MDEGLPPRRPGLSVRWKLTLSYAGFLLVAGILLLLVVWIFLLRYVPNVPINASDGFVPNRTDLQRAFFPAAAATLGFLLVVGLLGGWILAGRMLTPLQKITGAARRVAEGQLSHRIRMGGRADEIRELADVFDTMLDRVEDHVAEQQRFAANASHELRTPLAISQAILEVAQTDPNRDLRGDLDRLHAVNARSIALTEALLLLSRAGNAPARTERTDLSLLTEDAVETLVPFADERGLRVTIDTADAPVIGDPVLLMQMASNLVHNAIVHNCPGYGSITVSTSSGGGVSRLTVENTGPVVSAEQAATLTEPFQRGSERTRGSNVTRGNELSRSSDVSRSRDHAGVGLGLAIVSTIVRTHGGSLTLTPLAGGGLRVAVVLPSAP